MFRRFDIALFLFLILNALYWVVLCRLNNAAAPFVYFALPAVFIVPPAMFMNFPSAAVAVALSALAVSAGTPANPFAVCVFWLAAAMLVNAWRFKFRSLDAFSGMALMLFINVAETLLCALAMPMGAENFSQYARRFCCDLAASGALICACAHLCLALPVSIMGFFGIDITMNEDI